MPFVGRLTERVLAVNAIEAATTLAAKVFLAGVPALFVFAAFAPESMRARLVDSLQAVFGLPAGALDDVTRVYDAGTELREQTGAFSAVLTLLMAAQVTRTLQRLCARAWSVLPGKATHLVWRWLVWLPAWLATLLFQATLHDGFGVGRWFGVVLSSVSAVLVWWWTQHLLLQGRIGWLPLLPGAVLTGIGLVLFQYGSHLVMPRTVERSIAEFGPLGFVLTLMSWLIAACGVIVFAITIGAVAAREEPLCHVLGTPPPPGARVGERMAPV